jgi:hypothetical protein
VVDCETVTTKAGSFDTVRIESSFKLSAATTPLKEGESTYVLWFSPKLDHQQALCRQRIQQQAALVPFIFRPITTLGICYGQANNGAEREY